MKPLQKKLLRDLWRLRLQIGAIALLIACGVAVAVMAYSAQAALKEAQGRYYAETRFADVFATLKRAPLSVAGQLAAIDGVVTVDPRVLKAGLMDVPGLVRPAVARMISLPDDGRGLNLIVLQQGRLPERPDEAVGLKTFLDAAKVRLGQRLAVTISGKRLEFTVVGSALSPEYVYVPSPGSTMPDDAHQGVFWMRRPVLERAADLGGAFNSVALRVAAGAPTAGVIQRVDRILAPYGGVPADDRKDQVSNAFLEAEFKELETSASVLPPIFLIVAAVLVNLVIGRLVDAEHDQIGLLKAFGYSDLQAASVYLGLAAAIGLIGAAAGGLLGVELGSAITDLYREYMRFPVLSPRFHLSAFAIASGLAIAAAVLGSLAAVRRAVRMSPALAMQAEHPMSYSLGWLDRAASAGLDQPTRMILRNIERFPGRAAITIGGMAASLGLLVGTQFMFDSIEHVIDHAYYRVQRWGETIGFAETRDARALGDIRRMPGVYAAEPVRSAPAVISANGRHEKLALIGLDPAARLNRPLDRSGARVPFKGRGLVISDALARRLAVRPGQGVLVEITEGRRPVLTLPVTAVVEDYSGLAAYLDRRELGRMLGEGDTASGSQLLVAPDLRPQFYKSVEQAPGVVSASSRDETVTGWRVVMSRAFRINILFYVSFAGAIAFGVAYNMSRVSLAERARDLATLRVLGFDQGECAYILLGELAVLALVAIPIGLLAGVGLAHGLVALYSRQDLRLPAIITARSYGVSIGMFLGAVSLAALLAGRRIWTLDLVAVLKTRE